MLLSTYLISLFCYQSILPIFENQEIEILAPAVVTLSEESKQSLKLYDGTSVAELSLDRENRNFNLEIKTLDNWQLHEAYFILDSEQSFTHKLDFEQEFNCLLPQNLDGEEVAIKMELELIKPKDENLVRFATLTKEYKIPFKRAPKKRAQF